MSGSRGFLDLSSNRRWRCMTKLLDKLASVQYRIPIDLLSGRYANTQRVGKWHPLRVRENESSGLLVLWTI